jgi:hypothetical protein
MKLRISGNSIRLRLLRSDVANLLEKSRIEERIHFSGEDEAFLVYALECDAGVQSVGVRYTPHEVTVAVPGEIARQWARSEEVGIYAAVAIGAHGSLQITVEKDFACLDRNDADNEDTFPHPEIGAVC